MEFKVGGVRDTVAFAQRRIAAGAVAAGQLIVNVRFDEQAADPGHPRSKPYGMYHVRFADFAPNGTTEDYHAVPGHHRYGLRQHWRTGGVAAPQWRGNTLMFYDQTFDFPQRYVRENPSPWSPDAVYGAIRKWVALDEFSRYHKQWREILDLEMVDIASYVAFMRAQNVGVSDQYTYDDDIVFTAFESTEDGQQAVYTTWDQFAPPSVVVYTARNGVKIVQSTYDPGQGGDVEEWRAEDEVVPDGENIEFGEVEVLGQDESEWEHPPSGPGRTLAERLDDDELREEARQFIEDEIQAQRGGVPPDPDDPWWDAAIDRQITNAHNSGYYDEL